jgi:pyrroline-5-carboxylate reductase
MRRLHKVRPAYTARMAEQHPAAPRIAFIGGGNMAGALIGGLLGAGWAPAQITVVDPGDEARARLAAQHGVRAQAAADAGLAQAATIVWAVKPQLFGAAAGACSRHVGRALQVSVMAGIRSDAIARATGSEAVVRAMPNTPALIGRGMSALYARAGASAVQRDAAQQLLASAGRVLWVEREEDLDAVTALSGSGPAYVFYLLESLIEAAERMGLSPAQGRELALGTFAGAAALAEQSRETPARLREQVTSKGGTTQAALDVLQAAGVKDSFVQALLAAQRRARELGDEYGGGPAG